MHACRRCQAAALLSVALATSVAVAQINGGTHVAPSLSEHIQDAVSAAYGLLQLQGTGDQQDEQSRVAICATADAMLALIQATL